MIETGQIIKLKGEDAVVKITRHSQCSKCTNKCELATVENSHEVDDIEVVVNNSINAAEGERVKLEMQEQPLVLASLIIYLIPLFSLILGYFASLSLFSYLGYQASEGIGIIGSLVFLGLSFLLIRGIDTILGKRNDFQPEMVGKA
ncbi:MAG: SoxR reducing system RseC family protein [Halothermotrichaceae bacterium]